MSGEGVGGWVMAQPARGGGGGGAAGCCGGLAGGGEGSQLRSGGGGAEMKAVRAAGAYLKRAASTKADSTARRACTEIRSRVTIEPFL